MANALYSVEIGADYRRLQNDLNVAAGKLTQWTSKESKQARLNLTAAINTNEIKKATADIEKMWSSMERSHSSQKYNLFTGTKGTLSRQLDLSQPIKNIEELNARLGVVKQTIKDIESGKRRLISQSKSKGMTILDATDKRSLTSLKHYGQMLLGVKNASANYQKMLISGLRDIKGQYTGVYNIQQRIANLAYRYMNIWMASALVKRIAETTGYFEQQKKALESIIQDSSKADALYRRLQSYSLQSPLTFKELVTNTKRLTAYQIPTEDLFETQKRLADLSSGLGVDMERITLAYGQIRAASVLRGQEVRQLTEAGIPIINELAKKFSEIEGHAVSTAEVFKKISARGVSFEMVKDVIWGMTSEGGKFYNMQEKMMETSIYGPMQKMKDRWTLTMNEMGTGLSKVLSPMLKGIVNLMENWKASLISIIGIVIGSMIPAFTKLSRIIKSFFSFSWYGVAMAAIGAIAGLIWQLTSDFKKVDKEIKNINKDFNNQALDLIYNFNKLRDALRKTEQGTLAESEALEKIKQNYSEYIPIQDLTIEKLREESSAYDDLAASILAAVDAEKIKSLEDAKLNTAKSSAKEMRRSFISYFNDSLKKVPKELRGYVDSIIEQNLLHLILNGNLNYDNLYNAYNNALLPILGKDIELPLSSYSALKSFVFKDGGNISANYSGNLYKIDKYNKAIAAITNAQSQRRFMEILSGNGLYDADDYYDNIKYVIDLEKQFDEDMANISSTIKKTEDTFTNSQNLKNAKRALIAKYAAMYLKAMGVDVYGDKYDKLYEGLINGTVSNNNVRAFFDNIATDGLELPQKNYVNYISRNIAEKFPEEESYIEKYNAYIDSLHGELSNYRAQPTSTRDELIEKLKKAYDDNKKTIEAYVVENGYEDEAIKKEIDQLEEENGFYEEMARILNYDLRDNNTEKTQKDIYKDKLRSWRHYSTLINEAYRAEQRLMEYYTEPEAIGKLKNIDVFSKYFGDEYKMENGSINWMKIAEEHAKEIASIDAESAKEWMDDFKKTIGRDIISDEIDIIKRDIENLEDTFAKSKNAKKYFEQFVKAGMSWSDAVKNAQLLSGAFDMNKLESESIIEQINGLSKGRFGEYDLTTDAGRQSFKEQINAIKSIKYGPNDEMSKETREMVEIGNKILPLLTELENILGDELSALIDIESIFNPYGVEYNKKIGEYGLLNKVFNQKKDTFSQDEQEKFLYELALRKGAAEAAKNYGLFSHHNYTLDYLDDAGDAALKDLLTSIDSELEKGYKSSEYNAEYIDRLEKLRSDVEDKTIPQFIKKMKELKDLFFKDKRIKSNYENAIDAWSENPQDAIAKEKVAYLISKYGNQAAIDAFRNSESSGVVSQENLSKMKSGFTGGMGTLAIIDAIINGINGLVQSVSDVTSIFDELKESMGETISIEKKYSYTRNFWAAFSNVSQAAADGWNSLKSGDLAGAIEGTVKSWTEWFRTYNARHDEKILATIEDIELHTKILSDNLALLDSESNRVYGSNKWSYNQAKRNTLAEQYEDAVKKYEEYLNVKNKDQDKLEGYRNDMLTLENQLLDMIRSVRDEFLGTVDSISDSLGNAFFTAFNEGKNAARSWKDTVNNYIQQMVQEMLIAKFIEPKVEAIFDAIEQKALSKNKDEAEQYVKEYQSLQKAKEMAFNHYLFLKKLKEEGEIYPVNGETPEDAYKAYLEASKQEQIAWKKLIKYNGKIGTDEDQYYRYLFQEGGLDELAKELQELYPDLAELFTEVNLSKWFNNSATSSNTLEGVTEDTARRLEALGNTALGYIVSMNTSASNISINVSSIKSELSTIRSYMSSHYSSVESFMNGITNGTKKVSVKMN